MINTVFRILIFTILSTQLFAQSISFEAFSDSKQVVLGGYFEVRFTLKNARGSNYQAPNFQNFEVLSGPSSTMSTQIINGKMTQEMGYTYMLQPTKIGKFTIAPASIVVGNKKYRTQPLTIEVVKGKTNNAVAGQEGKEVFVQTEIRSEAAYVGQQILVDYKLYTTVDIDNYSTLQEPTYDGFYAQNIKRFSAQTLREVIGGVQYTTKVLKRVALFPQQAGRMTIEPLKLQVGINEGGSRRSGFFTFRNTRPLNVNTDAVEIDVKPLPTNAPKSFSGAVGEYTLHSQVSPNVLSTDDALSIKMTITGNGDVKRLQPAELPLTSSFEIYDPAIKDEYTGENQGQIICRKIFEYLVLPKAPGQFPITPEFTYFSPDSAKFITLKTNPTLINVRRGTNFNSNINTSPKNTETVADIRFIKTATKLERKGSSFFGSPVFWGLTILPFLILIGVFIFRKIIAERGNMNLTLLKSKKAGKVAQKKLATAKKFMDANDSRKFYDEISRASLGYISDKLNIQTVDLTKNNVREKLIFLNVSDSNIEDFMKILETAEMALFAGMDNSSAMAETYEKAINVVKGIEEEIG